MNLKQIPHFAILSGLFGTAASVFGKFLSHLDEFIENITIETFQNEFLLRWLAKIICVVLMILCNIFVWTFFVKALQQRGGSLVATVSSTATNYSCSAVIGNWIFGETISTLWWFGTIFIITGLILVSLGNNENTELDNKTTDEKNK